jgi:hypothetical protein
MQGNLFKKPPKYVIDSSSLMDIFGDTPWISKEINPGLWKAVEEMVKSGEIISHAEVLAEIKKDGSKGEELFTWANSVPEVFRNYDLEREGLVIRGMTAKYKAFVNNKLKSEHADPWIIAQAKVQGLTLITEETLSTSPNPDKVKIPNVCKDPDINVPCINLWGLTIEQGWKLGVS